MKLITKTLPNSHNLFLYGDQHLGSVLSSQKAWDKLLNAVNSEYEGISNNYLVDGGDMMEAIMVDDPRFSAEKLTEALPLEQIKQAVKSREPIKDKLLCILQGNHERKLWRFGDITQEVCSQLGVPYGTYTIKLTVLDSKGELMYKLYDTHGFRGITSCADDPKRRMVNQQLILKRQLRFQAGDCAVMIKHHVHKLFVCKPEPELYLTDDTKEIKQAYTSWGQNEPFIHPDLRWYGVAGSFLKLFGKNVSGYAEVFELNPVELGFLVLVVRNRKIVDLRPYHLKL